MSISSRTLHLTLASSAALALIVSAYVFSGPFSFRPTSADAATAQELLKSYASKDSDSDGLPDWEEALYGTDPANPESFKAGTKDGDAVSQGLIQSKFTSAPLPTDPAKGAVEGAVAENTMTAQFAREFFTEYLTKYQGFSTPSDTELIAFTQKAVQNLIAKQSAAPAFTAASITVHGTGATAIKTYLGKIDTALTTNSNGYSESELQYMYDAIERNDSSGLTKVRTIGASYTTLSKAVAKIAVPKEASVAHLRAVNAMAKLGVVVTNMGTSETDPVRSLMGLAQYQDAADELSRSFADLYRVCEAAGVTPVQGEVGYVTYQTAKLAHDTPAPTL